MKEWFDALKNWWRKVFFFYQTNQLLSGDIEVGNNLHLNTL